MQDTKCTLQAGDCASEIDLCNHACTCSRLELSHLLPAHILTFWSKHKHAFVYDGSLLPEDNMWCYGIVSPRISRSCVMLHVIMPYAPGRGQSIVGDLRACTDVLAHSRLCSLSFDDQLSSMRVGNAGRALFVLNSGHCDVSRRSHWSARATLHS